MTSKINIPVLNILEKFGDYLANINNEKIIFSGKFGTGKSFFLNTFFQNNQLIYNTFRINPVDYSTGVNEDIFEWIKIDIAKILIQNFIIPDKTEKFSKNLLIQTYLYNNNKNLFNKLILNLIGNTAKNISQIDLINEIKEGITEFKKFSKESNSFLQSDYGKLSDFLNIVENKSGSIFENDLISKIIKGNIEILKETTNKKSVLLIDDLDRLDPEHIFRILNIFSSHNENNKFGFDKIIIVCDIHNIEHIYKHKYGPHSDFEGYIEKFYSLSPFLFTIKDALIQNLYSQPIFLDLEDSTKNITIFILALFVKYNYLRIRNLVKASSNPNLKNQNLPIKKYTIEKILNSRDDEMLINEVFFENFTFEINYNKIDCLKGIQLLVNIFGSTEKVIFIINEILNNSNISNEIFEEELLEDIFESISILSHISSYLEKDLAKVFYSLKSQNNYFKAGPPIVNFWGTEFQIKIKWDDTNLYRSGHYFEEANFKNGINYFSSRIERLESCKVSILLIELKKILEFIHCIDILHSSSKTK
ncbi:MAG: P-loop NTPase fold protein [Ferruginibacter sp.]